MLTTDRLIPVNKIHPNIPSADYIRLITTFPIITKILKT
jgi:hypothetical protein